MATASPYYRVAESNEGWEALKINICFECPYWNDNEAGVAG